MRNARVPGEAVPQATHGGPMPGAVAPATMPGGAAGVPQSVTANTATVKATTPLARGAAGPKPKRWRVLNGGLIVHGGMKTVLRAGKEIDDSNYDLRMLRKQGIRLEEIVDEESLPALDPGVVEGASPLPPASAYETHESQKKTG